MSTIGGRPIRRDDFLLVKDPYADTDAMRDISPVRLVSARHRSIVSFGDLKTKLAKQRLKQSMNEEQMEEVRGMFAKLYSERKRSSSKSARLRAYRSASSSDSETSESVYSHRSRKSSARSLGRRRLASTNKYYRSPSAISP